MIGREKIADASIRFNFTMEAEKLATDREIRIAIKALKDVLQSRQLGRASEKYVAKYGKEVV